MSMDGFGKRVQCSGFRVREEGSGFGKRFRVRVQGSVFLCIVLLQDRLGAGCASDWRTWNDENMSEVGGENGQFWVGVFVPRCLLVA